MDGFTEQPPIVWNVHQTFIDRIFGIEQSDIYMLGLPLEVVAQHTIVEQHLHIMGFLEITPLLARLLLYQQSHILSHQVHSSTQSQVLADE